MESKEGKVTLLDDLGNTVLNALSAHVALLDGEGTIIGTNLEWREFGEANAIGSPPDTIGMSYLAVCDAAEGESSDEARVTWAPPGRSPQTARAEACTLVSATLTTGAK